MKKKFFKCFAYRCGSDRNGRCQRNTDRIRRTESRQRTKSSRKTNRLRKRKVEIPPENEEEQKGWIGVILNGDETEAYTLAHIDGIRAAAENVSLPSRISSGKSVSVRMMAAKVR